MGKENILNWQLQTLSWLQRTKTGKKKHYSARFGYNEATQQWLPIFTSYRYETCLFLNDISQRSAGAKHELKMMT